uniref:RNA polymerase subunit H/Rpb5 C-terminal domain-containing protein n=1 Tax=viral metagenome TaxID=1070528 RepID=A0A6C0JBZ8_9ZZZZ
MAQSGFIVSLAKSRANILDILQKRGFDISNYEGSNVSEVHSMYQNQQLDMLVENKSTGKKAYVKYHLGKTLRSNNIYDYIEDLFTIDEILEKKDDLIVIARARANDSLVKSLRQIWADDGHFITVIGLKHLQFNILEHKLVPPHRILTVDEKTDVFKKYAIDNHRQIPDISRFEPVALVLGMRPGNVCEVTRNSRTAINAKHYRICSP